MRRIFLFLLSFVLAFSITSCKDDPVDVEEVNQKTTIVFMPWCGLYSTFQQNLKDIDSAIVADKGINGRMVVFISTSSTTSTLYEVTYEDSAIVRTTLKDYSGNSYTTAAGISEVFNDIKSYPELQALNYSLIVGCHGCAWTYKNDWQDYPFQAKANKTIASDGQEPSPQAHAHRVAHGGPYPTTRFFGSVDNPANYGIDIDDLAEGLKGAGFGGSQKMQYILFDDCYMANVETAYALREVTNFLIGSTSEILLSGMPYKNVWTYLSSPAPAYESIVSSFYNYYKEFTYKGRTYTSAALSVIDCREVGGLAALMKEFNQRYHMSDSTISHLQVLDGYNVPLFYDMGDYVDSLCTDKSWLSDFHAQMDKVIKSTQHTDSIYTYIYYSKGPYYIPVKAYSGITISDPSSNPVALRGKEKTAWWKDTHNN